MQLLLPSPMVRLFSFVNNQFKARNLWFFKRILTDFTVNGRYHFWEAKLNSLCGHKSIPFLRSEECHIAAIFLTTKTSFLIFFHFVLGEADNILKEWNTQGRKSKVWRVITFCHFISIFGSLNYLSRHWEVEVVLNI